MHHAAVRSSHMIIRHRQKLLSPIQGKAVHIGGPVCSGAPRERSIGSQKALQCCVKTAHSPLPLVVLVGWLGAQQRHLRKYTHLWQSLGHPTVAVQPSTSSIVLPMLGDRQTAAFLSMLEHQRQAHLGRNLLLHIFSNAGFLFVGTALRQLALYRKRLPNKAKQEAEDTAWLHQAAGIIFDSAPAQLTPDIAARGFVAAALGEPALRVEARHPYLVRSSASVFTPFLNSTYISRRAKEVWEAWNDTAPTCPQLYLYSADDALIPPKEIENFQKLQAARGVSITKKMWTGSAHCEHYRRYPDAYTDELGTFASKCK